MHRPDPVDRASWWLLGSLYTTQSLGLCFVVVALVAILRSHGASLDTLSQVYLLGMVWPLKFLWAPLVDRVRFGRHGHYRVWLLMMQGALVVTLLALARLDIDQDFPQIYVLCLLIALLSATQDIATDGLACRILPPATRGLGNGIQTAGGLLGNLLGAGAVLMSYAVIGWQGCMLVIAAGTSVSWFQLLWFKEPPADVPATSTSKTFRRIVSFWAQPGSGRWMLMLLLYPTGSGLAYALITPVLVDAGWSLDRIGLVVNVFGSLAGVASALLSGWLITRIGRRPMMIGAALLQIPGILALALPVLGYTGELTAGAAVVLYFLFYNPVVAVLATLMMDRASAESPATDYTAQYSINLFFGMGMIAVGTTLAGQIGYLGVLAVATLASIAAAWLSWRSPPDEAATTRVAVQIRQHRHTAPADVPGQGL